MKKSIFILILLLAFSSQVIAEITIGDTSEDTSNNGTLTVDKPDNVVNSDVLVAFLSCADDTDPDPSAPAGWTTDTITQTSTGDDITSAIFYKVITDAGGEPASYEFTYTLGGSNNGSISIVNLKGVDTSNPIDVATGYNFGQDWSENNPCPTITTVTDNALVLTLLHISSNDITAHQPPAGTNEIVDIIANSANQAVSYFTQESAGATGNKQWTTTGEAGNEESHAYQVAFRPASESETDKGYYRRRM